MKINRFIAVLGALIAALFSSTSLGKDLVDLSQDYRLAVAMEVGCAKLEKLEQLDQELAGFITANSATEVAAQLVSGQTVTGLNQSELKASILELSGELSRTAREIHDDLKRHLAGIDKSIEGSNASHVLAEWTHEFERLTGRYHCVELDLSEIGNRLTLIKLNTLIQREKDGASAFNQWMGTILRPALRVEHSCDKSERLDRAIAKFRDVSASLGDTDAFQNYKKGEGDETVSLKGLLDIAQKTKRSCENAIAEQDGQAFEAIVEIAALRDQLDKTPGVNERADLLQNIVGKIDELISRYPDSPVGQSFIADGCYGPRICREQFAYEARQIINQLASLEEEGSIELERLHQDAECGRDLQKTIEERLFCFQSALSRTAVIEDLYRETDAGQCLSKNVSCQILRKEQLNDSIAKLVRDCEKKGTRLIARIALTEGRFTEEGLGLTDQRNLLVELKADYSELELHQACSPEAQEKIKTLDLNRAQELEAKILEISSLISRHARHFKSIQKTCARALSEPISRNDLPRIGECLAELDEFAQTAVGSELAEVIQRDDPVVPDVNWTRVTVPANELGELTIEGIIDGMRLGVVLKEGQTWTRISQQLVNQMNVPRTIRVSSEINDRLVDRFLVELNEIRLGELVIPQIVAIIDPELSSNEVVIGLDGIKEIDRETVDIGLELRVGTVVVDSEEEVGISLSQINQQYEDLLSATVDEIDSNLKTLASSLDEALIERYTDDYSEVIELISGLINEASIFDQYPALVLNLRADEIDYVNSLLLASLAAEREKHEDSARRICDNLSAQIESLKTLDQLEDLEHVLVESSDLIERLDQFYHTTDLLQASIQDPGRCPASPDLIETEQDVLADLIQAKTILSKATRSQDSDTRLDLYDEILDLLNQVSDFESDSIIATRIDSGSIISGVGFELVDRLVRIEEEAQETLAAASDLLKEAETEDRLPRQYNLIERAANLFGELLETKAALDRSAITAQLYKLETRLEELEFRLPVEPQTVLVEAGCFWMGAREDDEDAADDEQGVSICIEAFSIGVYEVTFHEYDRFVAATGRDAPNDRGWGRDYRPVINVSYFDIASYIEWLSYQTENSYRLPTEAEWEYAARADESSIYPWGNNRGSNRANCLNCKSDWSGERTAPVGSFDPNSWGLHDVAGNVAEKTCSIHKASLKEIAASCPPLEASGSRVVRGGSWRSHSRNIRLSYRDTVEQLDHRSRFHGFRLVKTD